MDGITQQLQSPTQSPPSCEFSIALFTCLVNSLGFLAWLGTTKNQLQIDLQARFLASQAPWASPLLPKVFADNKKVICISVNQILCLPASLPIKGLNH